MNMEEELIVENVAMEMKNQIWRAHESKFAKRQNERMKV